MSLYAIGDVQGCFDALQRLLAKINFDPAEDELWFAGDLVNRGTQSLETLRFIKSLGQKAACVLGNHDVRLLRVAAGIEEAPKSGLLSPILESPERDELIEWLRHLPFFKLDAERKLAMVHAGLLPSWSLQTAQDWARRLEQHLRSDHYKDFLNRVAKPDVDCWSDTEGDEQRLHFALNVLTHIRVCDERERILFRYKGVFDEIPDGFSAWFDLPHQRDPDFTVIIGHWAALGFVNRNGVVALDTGCVWGRELTAYRLDPGEEQCFSVACSS